jgi:hypothetical protein
LGGLGLWFCLEAGDHVIIQFYPGTVGAFGLDRQVAGLFGGGNRAVFVALFRENLGFQVE